jgi:hypothetical protein
MNELNETEIQEFLAWKREKDKTGFEKAFYLLEQSLLNPSSRQFNCVMPSASYRVLGEALLALKRRLIDE